MVAIFGALWYCRHSVLVRELTGRQVSFLMWSERGAESEDLQRLKSGQIWASSSINSFLFLPKTLHHPKFELDSFQEPQVITISTHREDWLSFSTRQRQRILALGLAEYIDEVVRKLLAGSPCIQQPTVKKSHLYWWWIRAEHAKARDARDLPLYREADNSQLCHLLLVSFLNYHFKG